jgi:glycerol kinase
VRDTPNMPVGTCIATFHDRGHYENDTAGKSHAAVLIAVQSDGILAWDQWVGHPVAQRVIRWRQGASDKVNDGDAFHAIETDDA